ncbi:MAG: NADH-quinone oxidoreductase subunit J [Deltaproteobacteria bacterium]|jgi:NADH-quinone oxidoreductase subunit J
MNLPAVIFYFLSAVILASAFLAATRRQPLNAILCLIVSLVGVAALFFLLGAPLLAAFQIILYAGAIVVLFLFVVMLFRDDEWRSLHIGAGQGLMIVLCLIMAAAMLFVLAVHPEGAMGLQTVRAAPRAFGLSLFRNYWFAVELVSFLLFVGLVGALHLAKSERKTPVKEEKKR